MALVAGRRWRALVACACGVVVATGCAASEGRKIVAQVGAPTTTGVSSVAVTPAPPTRSSDPAGSSGRAEPAVTLAPAVATLPQVTAPPTTAPDSPYLGAVRFDWPSGCSVAITEEIEHPELTQLTYRMQLQRDADDLVVGFTDLAVTRAEGRLVPAGDAAAAEAAYRLPGLRVDNDARVIEVADAALVASAADKAGALPPGATVDDYASQLENIVSGAYWESWAGFWVGYGRFSEPEFSTTFTSTGTTGEYETAISVESLPRLADGLARLRNVQTIDTEGLLRLLGEITSATPAAEVAEKVAAADGQRVMTTEVVADPIGMRVASASLLVEFDYTANGSTETFRELRRWTFDWSECAG